MSWMHSEWLPHEVTPVRSGVYQRDYGDDGGPAVLQFCWFDGAKWFAGCDQMDWARDETCPSMVPARWRGLTLEEFVNRHRDASRQMERFILDARP